MPTRSQVLVDLKSDPQTIANALQEAFPDRGSINLADPAGTGADLTDVDYAILWKPDQALFSRAPNLKVIFSGGAGVDHIMDLAGLPDIPVVRFVDRSLTTCMSEWVVLQCLTHLRQVNAYRKQATGRVWRELPQPEAREVTVGVMGLGVLGLDAVAKLKIMGFDVIGWSRGKKTIDGVTTYDADNLDGFLQKTDILVGLLPLTSDTIGIYDKTLFSKLRQGGALGKPVFINAGRGKSQNQADLTTGLSSGVLGGASLDVFDIEPLPAGDALWSMDNVVITPHVAAASDVHALFRNVEVQIDRFERGEALEHVVDRATGY
jgi:glyoxylate/hydroxypyruvate reductase A